MYSRQSDTYLAQTVRDSHGEKCTVDNFLADRDAIVRETSVTVVFYFVRMGPEPRRATLVLLSAPNDGGMRVWRDTDYSRPFRDTT